MKLKKIASLMLAGVMAVSMLAGCSGNSTGNGNDNGNTVVTPGASAIVTAFNNGQDADNKVKVNFTSNSSLDNALKVAVENAGSYDSAWAILNTVYELRGTAGDLMSDFGDENSNNLKDGMSFTAYGVMSLGSAYYWTEADAVNAAARSMDNAIKNGVSYWVDTDNDGIVDNGEIQNFKLVANSSKDGKKDGDTYYAYSYTGNVSMVAAQQEGGSTTYYVVYSITQTVSEEKV
ncbi:hypothetical protein B5G12_06480 [Faecalibacterium sp. An58]|uniref:hypothetical protein n=1 Tax=Faecalibacterium sp. An58 TaxID=1965648 RepID=UPI000B3716C2|nr:hypothetical protein [Faecalibacterium sp. An58]OUN73852.1 hypothetical protein B5G12_06480 [Faecalibacterium sp. An58]